MAVKSKADPSKPRIKVTSGIETQQRIMAVYEGASRGSRMGQKGLMGVSGPNADIANSLASLRKRSRHAVKNNPLAAKGKEVYKSNLVGKGIVAKWPNAEMQALWDNWINQCDADGIDNIYGLQDLAAGAQFESGEVLARRRFRRYGDGLQVPLQIQLMEGDHLDEGFNQVSDRNPIVMGIQFNAFGQRTHYHLWNHHPGDMHGRLGANIRKPVNADDIVHLYRRLRPGQIRGVPELTSVLIRLYEIDEMQDSTLVKQKTAQLFAWIISKKTGSVAGHADDNSFDGSEFGEAYVGAEGEQLTKIRSGGIHYLDEDEEIHFSSPDGIGANYANWLRTELRALAAGMGITYEQLTGDLENVNYTSLRGGLLEFRRRIEHLQLHLLIHRFCRPIAEWFADLVVQLGLVDLKNYWKEPWHHMPQWKAPKWDWVDPLKDVMADLIEVRAGFNTTKNKQAERSLDTDETFAQLIYEQGLNLVLDSNPGKVSKSGVLQDASRMAAAT